MTIFNQETQMTRAQFRAKYAQYQHPEAEFCDDFFYPVLDISQDVLDEMLATLVCCRIHGDAYGKETWSVEMYDEEEFEFRVQRWIDIMALDIHYKYLGGRDLTHFKNVEALKKDKNNKYKYICVASQILGKGPNFGDILPILSYEKKDGSFFTVAEQRRFKKQLPHLKVETNEQKINIFF